MKDWQLAELGVERVRTLATQYDEQSRRWEKLLDEYQRTTLEVNWSELSLEVIALTALCGVALLVIPRKASPN